MANDHLERAILRELRTRGVSNVDEFATFDDQTIVDTLRWFDAQRGRVGAGVLVAELRSGGRRPRRDLMAEQRRYVDELVTWLHRELPELGLHPAAVAALIRLHGRHGKDGVTVREHGPAIRAAVTRWEAEYGS